MHPSQVEYFVDLKRRLESTSYRGRGQLIKETAAFLGMGSSAVYSRLEEVGWGSGRKTRSDCGKIHVDENLAMLAGGLLKTATRANGKRILSINTVAEVLEADGHGCMINQATGEVTMPSPATLSRAMAAYGCHPNQTRRGSPAISLRSLHPNYCWQMDASVCVLFYLPRGEVKILREDVFYKNKPQNLEKADRARVIRWIAVDHYSHAFFARYTLGSEDAKNALAVLIEAMCLRENEADIFHGVPDILYVDKGSAFIAEMTKAFCGRLGIRLIDHAPGNPRAKGGVEVAHRVTEHQFESRLRFLATGSLDELNRLVDAWRIKFNARAIHSRHKKPRALLWSGITPEQLRVPHSMETLRELVRTPEETRIVSPRFTISYAPKGFGQQTYNLHGIGGIVLNQEVRVSVNPYEAPAIDMSVVDRDGTERVYTLQPVQYDKAGQDLAAPVIGEDFARHKDTATDKAVKRMDLEAYGTESLEDAAKARRAGRPAYGHVNIMADVEAQATPTFFPVRGRSLNTSAPLREAQPLSIAEAAMRLRRSLAGRGMAWAEKHMDHLMAAYPGGAVPVEDLDGLAELFLHQATVVEFEAMPLRIAGGAA
jgi:transposase InsO family protein